MNDLLPLIPYPQQVENLNGRFEWSSSIKICSGFAKREVEFFAEKVPLPIQPTILNSADAATVKIQHDSRLSKEAYELRINPHQTIEIYSNDEAGAFYALQTLLQLILANDQPGMRSVSIPCVRISDQPRFSWRGFMLDEARHFQGMQTVKDLLDWMAYFKFNVFHWHLTDDQGWRIAINRYPRLVEVGAHREYSQIGGFLSKKVNQTPHSGFYTQAEIKEIIQYANERHIQIVPEIEVPGHATAALAAYPELGCTGGPYQVTPYWGIHAEILCPGKPGTVTFLKNVLGEVLDLFPGPYIHTGGDEAPKKRWRACPDCQTLAKKQRIAPINGLQTLLTNTLSQFLKEHGRTLIGWNEMLADDLDPDAVVQYWLGKEKTILPHIRSGRKAILSNFSTYYLDHSYSHSPLDRVYQLEPVFADLESEYHPNILGIETPLWTEFVPSRARLNWQVFPRLLAVAETAWLDPQKKNLVNFHERLPAFLSQLERDKIGYGRIIEANPPAYKRIFATFSLLQAGKGEHSFD